MSPEQKKALRVLGRSSLWFSGFLIGAFALTMAPLPWPVLGIVLLVVAIGVGGAGMARARKVPWGRATMTSFGIGLAFAALLGVYSALLALQWPAQWEYQQCQAGALTNVAADACLDAYRRDSASIMNRVVGGLR
jgi:hypothetical protein